MVCYCLLRITHLENKSLVKSGIAVLLITIIATLCREYIFTITERILLYFFQHSQSLVESGKICLTPDAWMMDLSTRSDQSAKIKQLVSFYQPLLHHDITENLAQDIQRYVCSHNLTSFLSGGLHPQNGIEIYLIT